jgi:aminoglycoside 6-adenylyltransferase
VSDLENFRKDDSWIEEFGKIMIRWPLIAGPTYDSKWITRLVLFQDEIRIDFQITLTDNFDTGKYDAGFQVLIDKVGLTPNIPTPQFLEFNIEKPGREQYEIIINEFWWDATYVAKYLWRKEIPSAKFMLDTALRYKHLNTLLNWYIGLKNNWSVNPGIHGKNFEQYLDVKTWNTYKETYASTKIEENWNALFRLFEFVREIAQYIGSEMGFKYPLETEMAVRKYCLKIRNRNP